MPRRGWGPGGRIHPDAALLPYETFRLLLDVAEDIAIAQRIRERDATDSGNRTTLAAAAAEFGIELDAGALVPAPLHDHAKTGDLPELLAGLRLARHEDPVRVSDAQRRVTRIQQLRDR